MESVRADQEMRAVVNVGSALFQKDGDKISVCRYSGDSRSQSQASIRLIADSVGQRPLEVGAV